MLRTGNSSHQLPRSALRSSRPLGGPIDCHPTVQPGTVSPTGGSLMVIRTFEADPIAGTFSSGSPAKLIGFAV